MAMAVTCMNVPAQWNVVKADTKSAVRTNAFTQLDTAGKPEACTTLNANLESLKVAKKAVKNASVNTLALGQPSNNNLIQNPGFEQGTASWTFTSGTGATAYYPHNGSQRAYLDNGASHKVSQNVSITESGYYSLSGWIAAAREGATFGMKIRDLGEKNMEVSSGEAYHYCELDAVYLNAGDSVEVYVTGSPNGWVNIDDVTLKAANLLENGGFESGQANWQFQNATTTYGSAYDGSYRASLQNSSNSSVEQTITVPSEGTAAYTLGAMIKHNTTDGEFYVKVNGQIARKAVIASTGYSYKPFYIRDIQLHAGDQVTVGIKGKNSSIDNVSLYRSGNTVVYQDDFNQNDYSWNTENNCEYAANEGKNNSGCLKIDNSNSTSGSCFSKTLHLESNKRYIATCDVKAEQVGGSDTPISGGVGAFIGDTIEYGISADQLFMSRGQGSTGTFDWKQVQFDFYVPNSGDITLILKLESGMSGTVRFDNLKIVEDSDMVYELESNHIRLFVDNQSIATISNNRLNEFMNYMDRYYEKLREITGNYEPYNGDKLRIMSLQHEIYGWANTSGDHIRWYENNDYIINEMKNMNDTGCFSFGILHEIGHAFDHENWNFHPEVMANYKMYMAARAMGDVRIAIDGRTLRSPEQIQEFYKSISGGCYDNKVSSRNGMSVDSIVYSLIRMTNQLDFYRFLPALTQAFTQMKNDVHTSDFRSTVFDALLAKIQKCYNQYGNEVYNSYPEGELDYIRNGLTKVIRTILTEDFEASDYALAQDWNTYYNGGSITTEYNGGMNNSKCIKISRTTEGFTRYTHQFQAESGKLYRFTGYVKGQNLVCNGRDKCGGNISNNYYWTVGIGADSTGTFDWKQFNFRFLAPRDVLTSFNCCVGYYGDNLATGTAWFDNIKVEEVEEPYFN